MNAPATRPLSAEIVTVGTELLLGQIVDTNSAWLAQELAAMGVAVHYQTKVGDNHARMVEVFRAALARADVLLVTGGLGPTQDDITREAIAEVTGRPLRRDDEIVRRVREMFASRGREMAESNLRQADVPEGADWLPMTMGTAPGLKVPAGDGRWIYAFAGVPAEMKEMFTRAVAPDLRRLAGHDGVIRSRLLKTWGAAESSLAEMLHDRFRALEDSTTTTLAFLAGEGVVRVRITVRAADDDAATALLDAEEERCRDVLGDLVFGVDDDTLESVCVRILAERGLTLAAAESMTGGMVGTWLTRVAGASAVFRGSAVTYATATKTALLGVDPALLDAHGPVSEPVAAAMAAGARARFDADVAVAVTGSAGPDVQGSARGETYLAVDVGGDVRVTRVLLPGDRERVRMFATATLLDLLRRRLAETDTSAGALR